MYIHYAEVDLPAGKFIQLLFSTRDHLVWSVTEQKNQSFLSKDDFKERATPLIALIKQLPAVQRFYDAKEKVWIIPVSKWLAIKPLFQPLGIYAKLCPKATLYEWIFEVPAQHAADKVPDVEDFFYEQPQDQNSVRGSNELTKEFVAEKLSFILIDKGAGLYLEKLSKDELKKLYRRAAMKYHPDLNGGDATKMTELNFYWQEWQKVSTI